MTRPIEALQSSGLALVTGLVRAQLKKQVSAEFRLDKLVGPTHALPNVKVIGLSRFPSSHFDDDIQRN